MWDAHNIRGQALVELTVFGTIFFIIMAAMINYGLRYYFVVNGQQTAFRRALHIASDENQAGVTYVLIRDKHIPDPSDPFGLGTVLPTVASSSLVRSNQIDAQASDAAGLPTTLIQMPGTLRNGVETLPQPFVYKNAGFRWELAPTSAGYDKNQIRKYRLIYDDVVLAKKDTSGNLITITDYDPDDADKSHVDAVRLVDSCSGQVITYTECYKQVVKLVDPSTDQTAPCMVDCLQYVVANQDSDGMADYSCPNICGNVELNPPNQHSVPGNYPNPGASTYRPTIGGPWFADRFMIHPADASHSSPYYYFPVLEDMFSATGNSQMGMNSDVSQSETSSTGLRKMETSEGMGNRTSQTQTQDTVNWSSTVYRRFSQHGNIRADGSESHDLYTTAGTPTAQDLSIAPTTSQTYPSTVTEEWQEQWTTQK